MLHQIPEFLGEEAGAYGGYTYSTKTAAGQGPGPFCYTIAVMRLTVGCITNSLKASNALNSVPL